MQRTDSYVDTVQNINDPKVSLLKKTVRKINARQRMNEEYGFAQFVFYGGVKYATRYRTAIRGRLGKDNPNAKLYAKGGPLKTFNQRIRTEHAQRFDLYVHKYLQPLKG